MEKEPRENVKPETGGIDDLPERPVLIPSNVVIMHAQARGTPAGHTMGVFVTIDFDAVPGLREVRDRAQNGEVFDTVTRWWTSHPPQFASPFAVLSLEIPKIDFGIQVGIEIDTYSAGLVAAVQTKKVALIDSEMERRLKTLSPLEALAEDRSFAFDVDDVEPLRRILLQRLDFDKQSTDDEEGEDDAGEIAENTAPANFLATLMSSGAPPIVVLVDPQLDVDEIRRRLGFKSDPEGRWRAAKDDEGSLVRLDCALKGEAIGSWLIADPPQELVRPIASAAHVIAILKKPMRIRSYEQMMPLLGRKGLLLVADKAPAKMLKLMEWGTPP